ncbi:enoyl-CoA hydratase/isomerase family protein [Burkholderia gladioli]|uniref:enoyl-CoA hydratase/isomerase family protein n=1 Tax=Burkholderia gladioli TaxID=28095 RepID=UPI00163FF6AE|nr:enoyl-CoA hydratase-related protein [Burkholderia gladioli]
MSVELSFHDGLAFVTLNRPEALNALSFEVLREMSAAFDEVKVSNARALVVSGRGGKAFCAGADIKELTGRGMVAQREGAVFGQSVFRKLDQLLIPSVAVINGYAFGGGLELALASTFRVATSSAKMGLPEIKLGLVPGYGGTQRLPRVVGPARALELILSGRTVDAAEADRIGLVNQVVDDGDAQQIGQDYCAQFVGYSKVASMLARQAVLRACDVSLEEGLRVEADLSTLAFQSDDADEGMRAFIEKRKPQFCDR